MNQNQGRIVMTAAAVVLLMLVFPPFHVRFAKGVVRNVGYGFLAAPPSYGTGITYTASVDIAMLLTQGVGVVAVAAAAWWLPKDK